MNIGVHSDKVITMTHSSRLLEVLEKMETFNISAVPIVDNDGRVVDLYHRSDVTFIALAADGETTLSNLNLLVGDVLMQGRRQGRSTSSASLTPSNSNSSNPTPGNQTPISRNNSSTGSTIGDSVGYAEYPKSDKLYTCSKYDSLQIIFEKFAEVKFQTLVCVDDEQRCTGIVALGDLVAYFVDK